MKRSSISRAMSGSLNLLVLAALSFVAINERHHDGVVHGFSQIGAITRSRPTRVASSDNRLPTSSSSSSSSLRRRRASGDSVLAISQSKGASSSQTASSISNNNNNGNINLTEKEIDESMAYLAQLLKHQLDTAKNKIPTDDGDESEEEGNDDDDNNNDLPVAYQLAKGRFVDLATTLEGEQLLENIFLHTPTVTATVATPATSLFEDQEQEEQPVVTNTATTTPTATAITIHPGHVKFAINTLQSLLIYGMQIGVKGTEEMQKKTVRHLFRPGDVPPPKNNPLGFGNQFANDWESDNVRLLKLYRNVNLGKMVLAKMIRKRTAQGAFDLLAELGAWNAHEDTPLLRSGFPVRFLEEELRVSKEAESRSGYEYDPDALLRLRKDLRGLKVYTIDNASTEDIDDGISVEVLESEDDDDGATARNRYWVHIADVDRWAPRGSELLKVAERRGTSLYLPSMTMCMFPENMSSGTMSLEPMEDKYALSLGVELDSTDGSIIPESIVLTPSLIQSDYRLTYDQVDEMLDEGIGYAEEWQIGTLLAAATERRAHRVSKGSTEGMVPFPIPQGRVTATKKKATSSSADGKESKEYYDVSLKIETSHNSGANMTTGGEELDEHYDPFCSPISSSQLIVTEMMIMAGEAMGKWQQLQPMQESTGSDGGCIQLPNVLELPFRNQPAPDFKSRERETKQMEFLLGMKKRYPHAWYARRFFNKVVVSEEAGPHFGMGLDCYVQWSSPIRRLTDLQVHSALKRYLRRKRVNLMLQKGMPIPTQITGMDLGYDISELNLTTTPAATSSDSLVMPAIDPIDYTSALGQIFAARPVQFSSSNYWLYEYIRQLVDKSDKEVMFESVVLGCVNSNRGQYVVYVYALGIEHRYLSETGKLEEGKRLWLKVSSVNPRMELLTFSLASKSGGIHAQQLSAPAA